MKILERTQWFNASPEAVFNCLDDLGVTGMHMESSSLPMMGGKLQLEFLTPNKTGPFTSYRWRGNVLWWKLDFTVVVTHWVAGRAKTWQTIGRPRLLLYEWFEMHLDVVSSGEGTTAHLFFTYEKPAGVLNQLLCALLGSWYGKWCLNHMLEDAQKALQSDHLAKKTASV